MYVLSGKQSDVICRIQVATNVSTIFFRLKTFRINNPDMLKQILPSIIPFEAKVTAILCNHYANLVECVWTESLSCRSQLDIISTEFSTAFERVKHKCVRRFCGRFMLLDLVFSSTVLQFYAF